MKLVRRGTTGAVWALGVIVLLAAAYFGGPWLWGVLHDYIDPKTPTERKDLVNIIVLIGAGIVGALTAFAALLNAYFTRRNLQNAREALRQQRELDEGRAQDDALQAYLEQMGNLLTDHKLKEAQPDDAVALLALAQTHTVLRRLDAGRKKDLLFFLIGAGQIVDLGGADLSGADLRGAILYGAKLGGADLRGARFSGTNLMNAKLSGANLMGADLINAKLGGADLRGADLINAKLSGANLIDVDLSPAFTSSGNFRGADLSGAEGITNEELVRQAKSLERATMPNGQKYEDWLRSQGRGEDGKNTGAS